MATATRLMLREFRIAYTDRKPHYEYWFGEARQKAIPTWLHGLLQAILCEFLMRAGYRAGSEIELRVDPEWEPVPDVVGALTIELPYPTQPVDIVIEILSPTDSASDVLDKCRQYARIGIRKILVADPERMEGWEWIEEQQRLQHVEVSIFPISGQFRLLTYGRGCASRCRTVSVVSSRRLAMRKTGAGEHSAAFAKSDVCPRFARLRNFTVRYLRRTL